MIGTPGGHIRRSRLQRFWLILIGYLLYSLVVALIIKRFAPKADLFVLVSLGPLVMYGGAAAVREPMRKWLDGWRGERGMARMLSPLLGDDFDILHDLDVGFGNVDHIVVGVTGVFVIETKSTTKRVYLKKGGTLWCGNFSLEKTRRRTIRTAVHIRELISRREVKGYVQAVIALTASPLPRGPIPLDNLRVMEAGSVVDWIRTQPARLRYYEIERIIETLSPLTKPAKVRRR